MNTTPLERILALVEKLGTESKEAFYVYLGYELLASISMCVTVAYCARLLLKFFAAGRAAAQFERDVARALRIEMVGSEFGDYISEDKKSAIIRKLNDQKL